MPLEVCRGLGREIAQAPARSRSILGGKMLRGQKQDNDKID